MAHPTGPVRRVFLRAPAGAEGWDRCGWRSAPDEEALRAEHEALRGILRDAGAEVLVGEPSPGNPDSIYACDPALVTRDGVILLRPGKEVRIEEPQNHGVDLETAGVPVIGRLEAPATAEGGDLMWLDERTLIAGRSYRTNDAGIEAVRRFLPGTDVLAFDLPHHLGPRDVFHLMSVISPLDRDLVVAYPPLVPVRLMQLLTDRGIRIVEVPEAELRTQGPNVLALGPRRALALEGNPETRRRMEAAGVEVRTYRGDQISRRGDGGPTCLTLPLVRA